MCKAVMRWIRSGAGVWEGRYIRRWKWRGKVHRHSHHFNSLDTKYIARFLITITTMKSFTAISTLLLLVSSVSAQTRCDPVASAIPTCGVPCIASAADGAGCGTGDYACRCTNADAIQNAALGCVVGNCGIATALQVQASASAVCACVTGAARS